MMNWKVGVTGGEMKKKPAAAWPPTTALGLPARIPRRSSRARFVPTGRKHWTRCPRPAQILGGERLLITHHPPAHRSLGEGEPLITAFSIDTPAIKNHLNSFKSNGPISSNRHSRGGYPNRLLPIFSSGPRVYLIQSPLHTELFPRRKSVLNSTKLWDYWRSRV